MSRTDSKQEHCRVLRAPQCLQLPSPGRCFRLVMWKMYLLIDTFHYNNKMPNFSKPAQINSAGYACEPGFQEQLSHHKNINAGNHNIRFSSGFGMHLSGKELGIESEVLHRTVFFVNVVYSCVLMSKIIHRKTHRKSRVLQRAVQSHGLKSSPNIHFGIRFPV